MVTPGVTLGAMTQALLSLPQEHQSIWGPGAISAGRIPKKILSRQQQTTQVCLPATLPPHLFNSKSIMTLVALIVGPRYTDAQIELAAVSLGLKSTCVASHDDRNLLQSAFPGLPRKPLTMDGHRRGNSHGTAFDADFHSWRR